MSSKSYLIDTTQSMIIVDPNDFPLTMGATAKTNEDKPTTLGEVMAYDGRNVLPTPAGYMSYFDQSVKIDLGTLDGKLVQEIFFYQTASLHSVAVALCEDGIYVANATTGFKAIWLRIVDLSASVVAGVRRLWTVAVVANRTMVYQQGQNKFWAFVTPDRYADAATPSPITGATRAQVWTNWGVGLVSYIPTFLNMSGQVGLFRADNRLGFWDSDSAVAWSSNLYIEDFTPSVKTFAGVTKFADVAGTITKILGAGDGFIIYATKSIVYGGALEGSPEKWQGSAILSGQGVSFDTQITAGQPDTKQYCITSAGLTVIDGRTATMAAPGVIDYLALNNKVLSLKMIEGRFLFIHCADEFTGSLYGVAGELLADFNGNEYLFQPANYYTSPGSTDWFSNVISGRDGWSIGAFEDYEPIVGAIPPTTEPLIPCYDVRPFDSNWVGEIFSPVTTGTVTIDSKISSGHVYSQDDVYIQGLYGPLPSYYLKSTSFNQAATDLASLITATMEDIFEHIAYQTDWFNTLAGLTTVISVPKPTPIGGTVNITQTYTNEVVGEITAFNHIELRHLKSDANECHIKLYVDRYSTMKAIVKFTGVEKYEVAAVTYYDYGWDSIISSKPHIQEVPPVYAQTGRPATWFSALATADLVAEYKTVMQPVFGGADSLYTFANMTKKVLASDTSLQTKVRKGYIGWMLGWAPENVSGPSDLKSQMITYAAKFGFSRSNVNSVSVYPRSASTSTTISVTSMTMMDHTPAIFADMMLDAVAVDVYKVSRGTNLGEATFNTTYTIDYDSTWNGNFFDGIYGTAVPAYNPDGGLWAGASNSDPGIPAGPFLIDSPEDLAGKSSIGSLPYKTSAVVNQTTISFTHNGGANLTDPQITEWYLANGFSSSGTQRQYLEGTLSFEVSYEAEVAETEIILLDMELSGWGYIPNGGFSYRKTHSRHSSTTCPMPRKAVSYLPQLPGTGIPVTYTPSENTIVSGGAKPPYQWDYPTSLPLPDNFALLQLGSLAPHYPTYVGAVVYDQVQEKWGKFDAPHKLVYEINPINRADETITLNPDSGMLAGSLNPEGLISMFGPNNPQAEVVYGKIGYYRLGMTSMQEVRAYFNAPAYGYLIVEGSFDGTNVDPRLSQVVEMTGQTTALLNFTATAKWFNIRIEGQFRLITLQVNVESAGRR